MIRATGIRTGDVRTGDVRTGGGEPSARLTLPHDARHLRRKVLHVAGEDILVDLPQAQRFSGGDCLVLEDGREVEIVAAVEPLYALTAADALAHARLCWHLGNRHVPAAVEPDRVLIARDPVLQPMLEGLGVEVEEVEAPFEPVRGAYHSHD